MTVAVCFNALTLAVCEKDTNPDADPVSDTVALGVAE